METGVSMPRVHTKTSLFFGYFMRFFNKNSLYSAIYENDAI